MAGKPQLSENIKDMATNMEENPLKPKNEWWIDECDVAFEHLFLNKTS